MVPDHAFSLLNYTPGNVQMVGFEPTATGLIGDNHLAAARAGARARDVRRNVQCSTAELHPRWCASGAHRRGGRNRTDGLTVPDRAFSLLNYTPESCRWLGSNQRLVINDNHLTAARREGGREESQDDISPALPAELHLRKHACRRLESNQHHLIPNQEPSPSGPVTGEGSRDGKCPAVRRRLRDGPARASGVVGVIGVEPMGTGNHPCAARRRAREVQMGTPRSRSGGSRALVGADMSRAPSPEVAA